MRVCGGCRLQQEEKGQSCESGVWRGLKHRLQPKRLFKAAALDTQKIWFKHLKEFGAFMGKLCSRRFPSRTNPRTLEMADPPAETVPQPRQIPYIQIQTRRNSIRNPRPNSDENSDWKVLDSESTSKFRLGGKWPHTLPIPNSN